MTALSRPLRNRLESTVLAARDVAETAARAALEHLGTSAGKPPAHLTAEQKKLRVRLRAHARQLGDALHKDDRQDIDHLVREVAYEHWHRMLFARFLAENGLLVHENGVSLTLKDCSDLAEEEGASSGWELAGRYASRMLPQVFRPDAPGLALSLAPEHQRELEALVAGLDAETFQASDSLGWVYQYWQAKAKDEVNRSEAKIGADELPAVTQLFTEPYMVEFLLHNSLGAWWSVNFADQPCPVELTYLRTLEHGTPAAGTFETWPKRLADFKLLDPCCGSGHFLVSGFLMLVPMRMQAEGLSAKEAVDAVLRDNLYGLEIDPRCIEIAAFALALAAWRFPGSEGYRALPAMNLACCGLAIAQKEAEWVKLASGDERLANGMKALYRSFRDAPLLGSLLNPMRIAPGDLHTARYTELQPLFAKALQKEEVKADEALLEAAITAQGLAKSAEILGDAYDLVITNVPYLARGKQDDKLKLFCEENYPLGKNDLANVFLERCLEFNKDGGVAQIVMPQNWLFLTTYKKQRENLLKTQIWNLLVRLGEGGFESAQAAGAFTILLTLTRAVPSNGVGLAGIDASGPRTSREKAQLVKAGPVVSVSQHGLLMQPDCRVLLEEATPGALLADYADALVGLQTSDDPMFVVAFWEVGSIDKQVWELMQGTPEYFVEFDGLSWLVRWERGEGILLKLPTAFPTKGLKAVGRSGVAIHRMRELFSYRFGRERFHQSLAVILPNNEEHFAAIWCFCRDREFNLAVRAIDQTLKVTNATLVKVPFDFDRWRRVAAERYPNGLPQPYSDNPTQWIFHGHPKTSTAALQVAVARLLGYRWPAELDATIELSAEARAWINRSAQLDKFAEKDGIVCLPPVGGERPAADRLLDLLIAAWEDNWSPGLLTKLLADVDCNGKAIAVWLRDKFFEQHVELFRHRPFIWHIWDGKKDGFSALVNYHRLDRKNLETLTYTYIRDWIQKQERDAKNGVDGAEERADAAKELQGKLEAILEGEEPYDIFVRWKPLEEQPTGWEPDINDGVRLNIRPFVEADVLRIRPPKLNIKWEKDRGKDVESAPWFKTFGGERINDRHLSLDEKGRAREERGKKARHG
jgi:hypothetical protein